MARHLYTDDIVKDTLECDMVVDNEIRGIFGDIVDISRIPRDDGTQPGDAGGTPNILTTSFTGNPYSLGFRTIETGGSNVINRGEFTHTFNFSIPRLTFNYNYPVENERVVARIVCRTLRHSMRGTGGNNSEAYFAIVSFIANNPNITQTLNMGADIPLSSDVAALANIDTTPVLIPMSVTNLQSDNFSVSFNLSVNQTRTSDIRGTFIFIEPVPPHNSGSHSWNSSFAILQPMYIEIIVRGDTYRVTPQAFLFDPQEGNRKMHQMPQSTLLTTKATYNHPTQGIIPLWRHRGQSIRDKWLNGKQVMRCDIVVNTAQDVRNVMDEIWVFNVPRGTINENNATQRNNASFIQNQSGVAVLWQVVSAEFRYRGSTIQRLVLQEV